MKVEKVSPIETQYSFPRRHCPWWEEATCFQPSNPTGQCAQKWCPLVSGPRAYKGMKKAKQ
jgi:hypothetical protein